MSAARLRIPVRDCDGDQAFFFGVDLAALLEDLTGILIGLLAVCLAQIEAVDQRVFDGAALEHGDEDVGRVLESEVAKIDSVAARHLSDERTEDGLILLWRKDGGGGGVHLGDEEDDDGRQNGRSQSDLQDEFFLARQDEEEFEDVGGTTVVWGRRCR